MKIIFSKHSLLFFLSGVISLCKPVLLSAQISPTIDWQRCIGGYSIDESNQAVTTRDGGSIIVSRSYSKDGDVRNASPNEYNGWVAKLDQSGQIQWSSSIEGDNGSTLNSIIETSEGDFVAVGSTASLYVGGVKTHGGGDALVIKFNKDGDILWEKIYGGSVADIGNVIVENKLEGGGYVFAGVSSSNDGDVIGRHRAIGTDSSDAWVVKITKDGILEWQKCLGGSNQENISSIIQTQDGGYAFTGNTSSSDGDVVGHIGDYSTGWFVKLSLSGNIIWQKCLKVGFRNWGVQSIVKTIDGGLTIITKTSDTAVLGFHPGSDLFGNSDIYIAHFNSSGSLLWERCYGGSKDDNGESIFSTIDGGYLFIATVFSNDGDVSGIHRLTTSNSSVNSDVWIVQLRADGSITWSQCYGGSSTENGTSICQTKDGKILFVAYASSSDGDVEGLHSNSKFDNIDIWVVKLGLNADVPINSNFDFTGLIRDKFLKIYPNPSSSSVHLEMLPWFTAKGVEIYNLLGTKLSCETTIAENGANLSVKSLPNGTYIARVAYTTEKVNGTFTLPLIVYH